MAQRSTTADIAHNASAAHSTSSDYQDLLFLGIVPSLDLLPEEPPTCGICMTLNIEYLIID